MVDMDNINNISNESQADKEIQLQAALDAITKHVKKRKIFFLVFGIVFTTISFLMAGITIMSRNLLFLFPGAISSCFGAILHRQYILYKMLQDNLDGQNLSVDISYTELDDEGNVVRRLVGDEARKLISEQEADKPESKPFTENEKYLIHVDNIMFNHVSDTKEYLAINSIPYVESRYSAFGLTQTFTFSELNDAKAARNMLRARDYSVSNVEEIEHESTDNDGNNP